MSRAPLLPGFVALVAMALFADAQPAAPKPAPVPPLGQLLRFFGDPRLQQELALSDQQVKTLLAVRQKQWDAHDQTPPAEHAAKWAEWERTAAADIKACLSPEQFKRATELARQRAWSQITFSDTSFAAGPAFTADPTRVSASVLRTHPDLADPLALSDDQKKLLAGRPGRASLSIVLLTPDQAETARGLLGRIVSTDWKHEMDPRELRYLRLRNQVEMGSFGSHGILSLVGVRDVKGELKLTEEQEKKVAELREQSKGFNLNWGGVSPADAAKKAESRLAEIDKSLAAILKPEQLTRLRQLWLRSEHDPAWGMTTTPLVANLPDQLGLTAAQRKSLGLVAESHAAEVARAALAGKGYDEAHKAIRLANRVRDQEYEAVLTAAQKEKLRALVGEQFPDRVRPDYGSGVGSYLRVSQETAFGHYDKELTLLRLNKAIQSELQLTADQIAAAQKAGQALARQFPLPRVGQMKATDEETKAARTKFIGESLAAILDAKQAKRFREIMMQERQFADAGAVSLRRIRSAITYPGVAEEVKLTADQKKRLKAGDHPVDVLSDQQRQAIREMLGERYAGDYATPLPTDRKTSLPQPGAEARERHSFLPYLPWASTNLTAEQQSQIVAAINHYQAESVDAPQENPFAQPNPNPFRNPPKKTDPAAGRGSLALDRDIRPILTAAYGRNWSVRIDQLLLQSVAAVNLPRALARPEVAKALKMTPAQMVRIADSEDEVGLIVELVVQARLPIDKRNEVLREMRERLDQSILSTLTPEQAAKWKELTGDPYPNFTKTLLYHPRARRSAF